MRESLARVQSHEGFLEAEKTRDPLKLWLIVVGVHLLNTKEVDERVAKETCSRGIQSVPNDVL